MTGFVLRQARLLGLAAALVMGLNLAGCAAIEPGREMVAKLTQKGPDPRDPIEGVNRAIFSFNTAADNAITKPIAKAYRATVPELFRGMIYNVFSNVNDVWVGANNLLQGKPKRALSDWTRVLVNSVFGFAGVADIASEIGLERHNEDFGQTLGRWGVPTGPYIVLPLLGPSNLRDGLSIYPDTLGDPLRRLATGDRDRSRIMRLVDTRAGLLDVERLADSAALDRYDLIRDAYLARRRSLVYDGDPPEEKRSDVHDNVENRGAEKRTDESVSK